VKSHYSTVEDADAGRLRSLVKGDGKPKVSTKEKPAPEARTRPKPAPKRQAKVTEPKAEKEPPLEESTEAVQAEPQTEPPAEAPAVAAPLRVPRGITVEEFAEKVGIPVNDLIKTLLAMGEMKTITQSLSDEEVELLAHEFGRTVEIVSPEEEVEETTEEEEDQSLLEGRPPVITVMGHVDHGKSSILQQFRQKEMLALEAGGITQAIGAYQVHSNGKVVTFIDTPGHEAFTQMRARGAQVTDLAILVVAADDGVQPQTVEALDHARAAGVPVLVAVNKIDKPEADPQRVRQQLSELGLQPEEWGGDTVYVDISAKQGTNLEQLLEMILLVSELQELRANPKSSPRGVAIEAHLDKGRGPVATLLVQKGTLKVGNPVVCGSSWCKVRAMIDENGNHVNEAAPSQPVQVLGWSKVPNAGDEFRVVKDDREAKHIAQERETKLRHAEFVAAAKPLSLEDLLSKTRAGELPELKLIVKADTQGSLEALIDSLEKIDQSGVRIGILRRGAGAITENDVNLAMASGAIVVGFNVRPDASARQLAEREGVDVRTYQVIYQLLEDIEKASRGLLAPVQEEVVIGSAEVRATFKVPKAVAAGCMVTEGKVTRDSRVRLIRDGAIVYTGKVASLRRFKDEAREVAAGLECGITLEDYNDVKEGDVIEAFEVREVVRA
jgi:translation initiation factor IF-2